MSEFPIPKYREFSMPLPSGETAVLKVPFPMEPNDRDALFEILDLYKKALVKEVK